MSLNSSFADEDNTPDVDKYFEHAFCGHSLCEGRKRIYVHELLVVALEYERLHMPLQKPVVSSRSKDSHKDPILSAQRGSARDVLGFQPFCLIMLFITDLFLPVLYSEFSLSFSLSLSSSMNRNVRNVTSPLTHGRYVSVQVYGKLTHFFTVHSCCPLPWFIGDHMDHTYLTTK